MLTYAEFIRPLLVVLSRQSAPIRARDAYEAVSGEAGLSEADRLMLIQSGTHPLYRNRIGWAHDAIKRNGLSASPRRGFWELTEKGKTLVAQYPEGLAKEECFRIANTDRTRRIGEILGDPEGASPEPEPVSADSPEEQIDRALGELQGRVARELLDEISQGTPEFFEQLVLDVLHAMGYGQTTTDVRRTGRAGDEGIDGVISLDRLGLEKVYVQAKKWKGQVGSPEVQTFMGALQLQGATKGVLISSGPISGPARIIVKKAQGTVVLIDGQRLAELMIEHGVGISSKLLRVPSVDTDYFSDE